ncbi:MAG: hypothetical protein GY710_06330 [Desulfobacteraceae bacterium]|nr:hypothetical protein [Desulfobacteraceae bacterium]
MKDKEFLQWIHDRIIEVYGENKNIDFLHRLRKIIEETEINDNKFTFFKTSIDKLQTRVNETEQLLWDYARGKEGASEAICDDVNKYI